MRGHGRPEKISVRHFLETPVSLLTLRLSQVLCAFIVQLAFVPLAVSQRLEPAQDTQAFPATAINPLHGSYNSSNPADMRWAPRETPKPDRSGINSESSAAVPIGLRITWGGERPIRWVGSVRLLDGAESQWQNLRLLSIEPSAPGSVQISADQQQLDIRLTKAVAYHSFSVDCQAGKDARLEIQLRSPDQLELSFYQVVELKQIMEAPWSIRLGPNGHGLWVERPAEDQIRIKSNSEHSIFRPGDPLRLTVTPAPQKPNRAVPLRYHAVVREVTNNGEVVWEDRGELQPTANGDYPPLPEISLSAGPAAGVYEFQFDILPQKPAIQFLPGNANTASVIASRKRQWIVLDQETKPDPNSVLGPNSLAHASLINSSVAEAAVERLRIQPDQLASSWQRALDLPRMNWVPRISSPLRLVSQTVANAGSETLRVSETDGVASWELGAGQWRKIELPAVDPGMYIVQIHYRAQANFQMSLNALQADRWDRLPHWTSGSQLRHRPLALLPDRTPTSTWQTWETIHWFNAGEWNKPPDLLLRNRGSENPIHIGDIRLLKVPASESNPPSPRDFATRSTGFYLETPLLGSIFAGRKSPPSSSAPPLNDCLTYYDATERLISYLKAKQHRSVWLPVLKQGGALFPTAAFQTSPRFENSVFAFYLDGEERFDVVELILRRCQEEQLAFVPILDFSTLPVHRDYSGVVTHNPLDPKFQELIREFVVMFLRKYQQHSALGGIAIELNADSPLLFLDEKSGMERDTLAMFLQQANVQWPADKFGPWNDADIETLSRWTLEHQKLAWLQWRATQLTRFMIEIQNAVASAALEAGQRPLPVHFVATNLLRHRQFDQTLYPSLRERPQWGSNWLRLGLDFQQFAVPDAPSLIFQSPALKSDELAVNRRVIGAFRTNEYWQATADIRHLGGISQHATAQSVMEPLENSHSDHVGQPAQALGVVDALVGNEQVWAEMLRARDFRHLLSQAGGVPRTLIPSELRFVQAFQTLPDSSFETIYKDSMSGVVVRQATWNDKNFVYLVNAAKWPVRCEVQTTISNSASREWTNQVTLKKIRATELKAVDQRLQPAGFSSESNLQTVTLTLDMEASSLVVLEGPVMKGPQVTCSELELAVFEHLQAIKDSLFRRLRQAANHSQGLHSLQNASFEAVQLSAGTSAESSNRVADWSHGLLTEGQVIETDTSVAHSGSTSLHVVNPSGILWLRSAPIPVPTTGRLSVVAWVRNHPGRPASSIRFAIDGLLSNGDKYYRFAEIPLGHQEGTRPTTDHGQSWRPVAVHFDDLPEEGLSNLRIGFDLMNPGEVWLDSVQCFDRWMDTNDQKVVSNRLGLAAYSLENKRNAYAALQALDEYWMQFLLTYVPDPNENSNIAGQNQAGSSENRARTARGARRFLPIR